MDMFEATSGSVRSIGLSAMALAAALAAATRADVTIVSEVNVTAPSRPGGGPGMGFGGATAQKYPKTISIYYKGDKARTEEKGGAVTIYDADTDKIYTLDTVKKTYYEQVLSQVGNPGGLRLGRGGDGAPAAPASKVTLTHTSDTQTIAATKAEKYTVDGSVSFGFGGGGGFGRRGGGGFGGGQSRNSGGGGGGFGRQKREARW